MKDNIKFLVYPAATSLGIFLTLTFDFFVFPLICLAPLFYYWITQKSKYKIVLSGLVCQILLNIFTCYWLIFATSNFWKASTTLSVVVFTIFALIANMHIFLTSLFYVFLKDKRGQNQEILSLVQLASMYVFFEISFSFIFPWYLGYSFFMIGLPAYQLADIIGFSGLSLFVVIINAFIVFIIRSYKSKLLIKIISLLTFYLLINFLGYLRSNHLDSSLKIGAKHSENKEEIQQKSFLIIQPNISNEDKSTYKTFFHKEYLANKTFSLTEEAIEFYKNQNKKIDLVIWPETAFPDYLDSSYKGAILYKRLRDFIKKHSVSLLTGAYSYDYYTEKKYNGMFLFDEKGELTAPPYTKKVLIDLAETSPLEKYLPDFIKKHLPKSLNLHLGKDTHTLLFDDHLKIAPLICYEGIFSSYANKSVVKGGNLFINITNDEYFGSDLEKRFHFYFSITRAIEYRIPFIRVTNSGISGAVNIKGDFLTEPSKSGKWHALVTIPLKKNPTRTIYLKYGDYYKYIALLFFLFVVAYTIRIRLR